MKTNNINCFIKILKKNNFKFIIIKSYDDYKSNFNLIDKIIIPGIGSFNLTMNYLINTSLDKVILEHNENKKKILAICIGMQILTEFGDEGGLIKGLGIIKNSKTEKLKTNLILPNIGWNNNIFCKENNKEYIINDINLNADFYFVHSYNVILEENDSNIFAYSYYGNSKFISIIKNDNIIATQFHPEKSGLNGIKLIKNFLNWK